MLHTLVPSILSPPSLPDSGTLRILKIYLFCHAYLRNLMVTYLKSCPDFCFDIDEQRMSLTPSPLEDVGVATLKFRRERCREEVRDGEHHQETIREKGGKYDNKDN